MRRPVHREAVAEERRRVVLEEVAGEQHVGVRHEHDDVVVGVAAAEIAQLDRSAAAVDLDVRRLDERPVGRIEDDLGELAGQVGDRRRGRARCFSPVERIILTQRSCPQIPAGRKAWLPKQWS